MQEFGYSLTELEDMSPLEREIYLSMLVNHLKEKIDKARAKQA